jgi:hypothetical protein
MDEDLAGLSHEQLIEEVRKLRRGIRAHRDSSGHELSASPCLNQILATELRQRR